METQHLAECCLRERRASLVGRQDLKEWESLFLKFKAAGASYSEFVGVSQACLICSYELVKHFQKKSVVFRLLSTPF